MSDKRTGANGKPGEVTVSLSELLPGVYIKPEQPAREGTFRATYWNYLVHTGPGMGNRNWKRQENDLYHGMTSFFSQLVRDRKNRDHLARVAFEICTEVMNNILEHGYRYKGGPIGVSIIFPTKGPLIWLEFSWLGKLSKDDFVRMENAMKGKTDGMPLGRGNGLRAIRLRVKKWNLPRNESGNRVVWRVAIG